MQNSNPKLCTGVYNTVVIFFFELNISPFSRKTSCAKVDTDPRRRDSAHRPRTATRQLPSFEKPACTVRNPLCSLDRALTLARLVPLARPLASTARFEASVQHPHFRQPALGDTRMPPPIVIDSDDEMALPPRSKRVTRSRASAPDTSDLSDPPAPLSYDSSDFVVDDSDETPVKKRKSGRTRTTRSSKRQSEQIDPPRRSTRETRNTKRGSAPTPDLNSSQSPAPTKYEKRERVKTTTAKAKLRVGERPRDEHSPVNILIYLIYIIYTYL